MLAIHNPATGELLGEVPTASAKNVAEHARAARAVQPGWAALALATRLEILQRFRAALAAEIEPLSITLTSEVGKPIRQSRNEIACVAIRPVDQISRHLTPIPVPLSGYRATDNGTLQNDVYPIPSGEKDAGHDLPPIAWPTCTSPRRQ